MNKQRILYVEDETGTLTAVQKLLETRLPVTVDICTTAQGGALLVNRYCYDLIISDIGLPIIDGIMFIEKVLERDPDQPVMLLSEYDNRGHIKDQADRIGVPITPKFTKTTPAQFVEMVRDLLTHRPCPDRGEEFDGDPLPHQQLPPIELSSKFVSQVRAALVTMRCSVGRRCSMHEECQQRARLLAYGSDYPSRHAKPSRLLPYLLSFGFWA